MVSPSMPSPAGQDRGAFGLLLWRRLNRERLQADCEPAHIDFIRARRRRKIELQDEFAGVPIHKGGGNHHFHSSFTLGQPQGADEAAVRRDPYGLRVSPCRGARKTLTSKTSKRAPCSAHTRGTSSARWGHRTMYPKAPGGTTRSRATDYARDPRRSRKSWEAIRNSPSANETRVRREWHGSAPGNDPRKPALNGCCAGCSRSRKRATERVAQLRE